ncbi:hypothetical protein K469DRAFT_242502 [Zopfia rhizophila CBS 207.26]|uniref:Uncharacterized protein n=1 Tax=Zopfia rhizophila CBS 207.26 TaxID=1314779 RepID=A0A6A6ERI4_9PEZI|nr:hypothetical protein K469DRAFT_242502 [Zopfia rhizophila CBS 207.26]
MQSQMHIKSAVSILNPILYEAVNYGILLLTNANLQYPRRYQYFPSIHLKIVAQKATHNNTQILLTAPGEMQVPLTRSRADRMMSIAVSNW